MPDDKTPEEQKAARIINLSKKAAMRLRHGKPLKEKELRALENLSWALGIFGHTPADVKHER